MHPSKLFCHILFLTGMLACAEVSAQTLEVSKISSDSLVRFIRKEIKSDVYLARNAEDVTTYSIKADKDHFLASALKELSAKGYVIDTYEGGIFITESPGISTTLPAGYFAREAAASDVRSEYLGDGNAVTTFQNKIYEIGTLKEGRTGKAVVRGYVRDAVSGEPLPGVSVYDPKTGSYAVTDAHGFYKIQMPVGEGTMGFSGYSLEDVSLNVIVHDDGGLDVLMKEKVTALNGATVSAESMSHHRNAALGLERVQMQTIRKIPSAFGEADVLKAVMALPGVKSSGEASNGFTVRGGAVDQNLILFNEGTVFNSSHMFGVVSTFNPDVVSEVELYKSSIPAEFGGRISSVLDIKGKEGNANKVTGSLGLGLLTSSFSLEGPLKKGKTTFVLGGRTTYSDWMLNLLPESSYYAGGTASFSDLNASISHKINDKNNIHAYAYWSGDRFGFSRDTTFRYHNLNAAVKWISQLTERSSMTATAGYDSYDNTIEDDGFAESAYTLNTTVSQRFAKLGFKTLTGERNTVSYGLNGIMYMLNPGTINPATDTSATVAWSLPEEHATEGAVYLSDEWKATEKLTFETGVRASALFLDDGSKPYVNPELRFSAKYSPAENFSIKAGFNSMSQYIHLLSNTSSISPTDTWKLSDKDIKPQTGWQGAGGLYWTLGESSVDISIEGYYKMMSHYLDYKSGAQLSMNPNLAEDLVETYGKAYGAELMIKKASGKLTGWLSYTYSRSLLKEMEDRGISTINGGQWYNAPLDKPHDVKFVGNFKFTHRFSLSCNLDYSTGRPVTIPLGSYSYAGGSYLAYSDRNAYRIPDYFRMDLAMIIEPGHYLRQLTHLSVTFGVYNVTGRKNAYSIYYTNNGGSYISGNMISVFATQVPYVNLNLRF